MSVGWGQDCIDGVEVELWGECYNIETTTELDLSGSGISGNIPTIIGDLINLTYLDLSNNQLSGSIPSHIGSYLINLTYLDLSNNMLSGPITSHFQNLINLVVFDVSYNNLSEHIRPQMGYMTNLIYLRLGFNQFSGGIPSEIGNLTNLTILDLNNNQLTGDIPESICFLFENNCFVSLFGNNFCPPYLECIGDNIGYQDTSECEEPSLCDEEIEVELWGECYNIDETTSIILPNSGLTGDIPPEIGNLTNLRWDFSR